MRRFLKLVSAAILGILLGVGAYGYLFVNRVLYAKRAWIAESVGDLLGVDLAVGSVRAKLIPFASLSLEKVVVRPNGSCSAAGSIQSILVDVDVLALLRRELAVEELIVSHPSLPLTRVSGPLRWKDSDSVPCQRETAPAAAPEPEKRSASPRASSLPSSIGGYQISFERLVMHNGLVLIDDEPEAIRLSDIEIRSDFSIDDWGLVLKNASVSLRSEDTRHSFSVRLFSLDFRTATASFREARTTAHGQSVVVEEGWVDEQGIFRGSLRLARYDVEKLIHALPVQFRSPAAAFTRGRVDLQAEIELAPDTSVKLDGSAAIENLSLKIGDTELRDVNVSVHRAALSLPHEAPMELDITDGKVRVESSTLNISELLIREHQLQQLSLSASELDLQHIRKHISATPAWLHEGRVSLSLASLPRTDNSDGLRLKGDLELRNYQNAESSLAIGKLKLSEATFAREPSGAFAAQGSLSVNGLRATDKQDRYGLGSATSSLSINGSAGGETSLQGKATVEDFSFADDTTTVENVHATLHNISGVISADGTLAFRTTVDGDTVQLRHPAIVVHGVTAVHAPIQIRIPAEGGYDIRGPVQVQGGEIELRDRRIDQLSGNVAMLVSRGDKDFASSDINFRVGEHVGTIASRFRMTDSEYALGDTTIGFANGTISAKGRMGRGDDTAVGATLQASDLELAALIQAVKNAPADEFSGVIRELEAQITSSRGSLADSLRGEGNAYFQQGLLKSVNLTEALMRAVSDLPVLSMVFPKDDDESAQELRA
ncbi:MAG: hypothetical protein KDD44_01765, partial [Bdellovibrionales bacterium]|nr:hypothetical protein [Bdellovibrionales bacterium]